MSYYEVCEVRGQVTGNRIVTYAPGNAQRAISAKDTADSINYAQSATYAPPGELTSVVNGFAGSGFAGITESRTYNHQLMITAIQATSSAGTALNLAYGYSTGNNGNIATQTNNVTNNRTQSYTYDNLNRLLTANSVATSGADCWGQSFGNGTNAGDDPLGNLLAINQTKCSPPSLSVSVNNGSNPTKNQITSPTGFSYDSSGDMTADGVYSYTYDAEYRIITASGMTGGPYCYTYDGNGLRVMKANGSSCTGSPTVDVLYWRNIAGQTIAETDGSGSTTNSAYNEYVFFGGRRIAQSNPSSGSVYYYFVDHLGSTRTVTTASGSPCYEADFLPYGEENTPSGFTNTCSTNYKFTGYERDAETAYLATQGNDYAFARYYSSRLGRFMSGDPLDGDITDPQTLNRYAYVLNNPVNLIDPLGLEGGWAPGYCATHPFSSFCWVGGPNGRCTVSSTFIGGSSVAPCPQGAPPILPIDVKPPSPKPNPCQGASDFHVSGTDVSAQLLDLASPFAVTEINFAASGDINGFNVVIGQRDASYGGVIFQAGSSIHASFNGQQLSISATGGSMILSQPGSNIGARIAGLTSRNGTIRELSGNATFYGIPVPWTSTSVMNTLNTNPSVTSALTSLQKFLGKCATSQ